MAYTLSPKASDFRGYPFESYTTTAEKIFYKSCPSGQTAAGIRYSKTYTSYINQADAIRLMNADYANFISQGQANANSQGTCVINPAPLDIKVNGYLRVGYFSVYSNVLYSVDRNNHCVTTYSTAGPVIQTDLELKNGTARYGTRGVSGSSQYHLNNPSMIHVSGNAVAVVNNGATEIKLFNNANMLSGRVCPGAVIARVSHLPDSIFIQDVTMGPPLSNGLPDFVYFSTNSYPDGGKANIYRVPVNNSNPENITLVRNVFNSKATLNLTFANYIIGTDVSQAPVPSLIVTSVGSVDALVLTISNPGGSTPGTPTIRYEAASGLYISRFSFGTGGLGYYAFGLPPNDLVSVVQYYVNGASGGAYGGFTRYSQGGNRTDRDLGSAQVEYLAYDPVYNVLYGMSIRRRDIITYSSYTSNAVTASTGLAAQ